MMLNSKNILLNKRFKYITMTVLGLSFATMATAQTKQQREKIRAAGNPSALAKFAKSVSITGKEIQTLRQRAQKLNIPFDTIIDNQAMKLVGFQESGQPRYITSYAAGSVADVIRTSSLWSQKGIYNLEGQGMKLCQWDEGSPLLSHVEFEGRVSLKDNSPKVSMHSTGVASCIVGARKNHNTFGMASQASLDAYDWTNDMEEIANAAASGILVGNASYGEINGWYNTNQGKGQGWYWFGREVDGPDQNFGAYGKMEQTLDYIAINAPHYLHIMASANLNGVGPRNNSAYFYYDGEKEDWVRGMNSNVHPANGGENGFDCIPKGSTGKNYLAIGAINKPSDVNGPYQRASFSSTGPVNDGRVKPDLVAVGTSVGVASSSGPNQYSSSQGTSFSAPMVTGSLLLLQQLYSQRNNGQFMRSSTLRAVAVNTATEAGNAPGPDYQFGWGVLNSLDAANAIADNGSRSIILEEKLTNQGKFTRKVKVRGGGEPLKVTLAWIDPVSPTLTNTKITDDRTAMLVNDLDLRVIGTDGTILPWKLDPNAPAKAAVRGDNTVDNVEHIIVENTVAGQEYTIEVTHKGRLKTNQVEKTEEGNIFTVVDTDEQPFSLVATGLMLIEKDLSIKKVTLPSVNSYNQNTSVSIVVSNEAQNTMSGAKLKVTHSIDGNVQATNEYDVNTLSAGQEQTIRATLDLSQTRVTHTIAVNLIVDGDQKPDNNQANLTTRSNLLDLTVNNAVERYSFETPLANEGWTLGGSQQWTIVDDSSNAAEGTHYAMIDIPSNYRYAGWLYTPLIKLQKRTDYWLSFKVRGINTSEEKLVIKVGAEGLVATDVASVDVPNSDTYQTVNLKFQSFYFAPAMLGFSTTQGNTDAKILIDDIIMTNADIVTEIETPSSDKAFQIMDKGNRRYELIADTNGGVTADLFNLSGQQVLHQASNTNTMSLETSTLSKGIYLLKLATTEGVKHTTKLILR